MSAIILKFYKYAHRQKTDGAIFSPYGLASTQDEKFLKADLIHYMLAPGEIDEDKEKQILKINRNHEIPVTELRKAFEEIDHRVEERKISDKAQLKKLRFLGSTVLENGSVGAVYCDAETKKDKYALSEDVLRFFLERPDSKTKGDIFIPEAEIIRGLECIRLENMIGASISHDFK